MSRFVARKNLQVFTPRRVVILRDGSGRCAEPEAEARGGAFTECDLEESDGEIMVLCWAEQVKGRDELPSCFGVRWHWGMGVLAWGMMLGKSHRYRQRHIKRRLSDQCQTYRVSCHGHNNNINSIKDNEKEAAATSKIIITTTIIMISREMTSESDRVGRGWMVFEMRMRDPGFEMVAAEKAKGRGLAIGTVLWLL